MKYILDDAIKVSFITMLNKLIFAQQIVLKPLLNNIKGLNDKDRLLKIEELETLIEINMEQRQVLTSLMASGYLEPALFNKERNTLTLKAETLREEKEKLMHSIGGDMTKAEELQNLIKFTTKRVMLTEYDDEVFLSYVERVTVL